MNSGISNPNRINNIFSTNMPPPDVRKANLGQVAGQDGTNSRRNWGDLSRAFDELMSVDIGDWVDKRDIAGQLGTTHTDDAFRKLIYNRKKDTKIRQNKRNPYLIQWINKSYKVVDLSDNSQETYLPVKLPLDIHELVKVPQGSVNMIAGFTSAGKTAYQLEIADLNVFVQDKVTYYWFNEMSIPKLKTRLEDFPNLYKAWEQGKFKPVRQEDFEFADTVEPDAINIYDYIDRDEDMWLIGQDIKQIQVRLATGVAFIAIQKKAAETFGYGGLPTAKLSNLYVTLDCNKEQGDYFSGKAKIVKAKDWVNHNPVYMSCDYKTTGKHGKLERQGIWGRG